MLRREILCKSNTQRHRVNDISCDDVDDCFEREGWGLIFFARMAFVDEFFFFIFFCLKTLFLTRGGCIVDFRTSVQDSV